MLGDKSKLQLELCGPDDILPPSLTWVILFDAVVENGDGDASPREPLAPRPLHVHVVPALPVFRFVVQRSLKILF